MNLQKINIASVWSALVATGMAMLWLFQNIAWASDIDRIEVRLIKRELRDLREELTHATDEAHKRHLEEYIEEAIDDLCAIEPEDRECSD